MDGPKRLSAKTTWRVSIAGKPRRQSKPEWIRLSQEEMDEAAFELTQQGWETRRAIGYSNHFGGTKGPAERPGREPVRTGRGEARGDHFLPGQPEIRGNGGQQKPSQGSEHRLKTVSIASRSKGQEKWS